MRSTSAANQGPSLTGGIAVSSKSSKRALVALGFARWKRESKVRQVERRQSMASSRRSMSYSVSQSVSLTQQERTKQDSLKFARRRAKNMAAQHCRRLLVAWRGAAAESHLEFTYQALQHYRAITQALTWRYWVTMHRYKRQRMNYMSPSRGSAYSVSLRGH